MLSADLRKTLNSAIADTQRRRHEFVTLEHLLLALTDDGDAIPVMRACGVELDRLRGDLSDYIDNELANLPVGWRADAIPLAVPGLDAERCLVVLTHQSAMPSWFTSPAAPTANPKPSSKPSASVSPR